MLNSNLFEDTAPPSCGERFETLPKHRNLVVERIISSAATTPSEFVQYQDEWVLLVRGTATLEINGKTNSLKPGTTSFFPLELHIQSGKWQKVLSGSLSTCTLSSPKPVTTRSHASEASA